MKLVPPLCFHKNTLPLQMVLYLCRHQFSGEGLKSKANGKVNNICRKQNGQNSVNLNGKHTSTNVFGIKPLFPFNIPSSQLSSTSCSKVIMSPFENCKSLKTTKIISFLYLLKIREIELNKSFIRKALPIFT